MRRWTYILILAVIWAASMGAIMLGMDSLLHPPFIPHALFGGAYFGTISTVSLAEEISEWRAARDYRPNCPLGRRGSGGWGRVFRRCSEAVLGLVHRPIVPCQQLYSGVRWRWPSRVRRPLSPCL